MNQEGGYIPSLTKASPTHLLIMAAIMMGTMYVSPPVNSNIITTRETVCVCVCVWGGGGGGGGGEQKQELKI